MQEEVHTYDTTGPFLVFGAGVTGRAVVHFLLQQKREVFWVDQTFSDVLPTEKVKWAGNEEQAVKEELNKFSGLVIKSPGIRFDHPFLSFFSPEQILGECEFAASFMTRPLICVTGSNGKTTVTSLLYSIFKTTYSHVALAGNIGFPLISFSSANDVKDPIIVEMSSFQIEELRFLRPKCACITNLSPTHMERYANYEAYKMTKFQLFKNMKRDDQIFLPADLEEMDWLKTKKQLSIEAVDYGRARKELESLLEPGNLYLKGEHNLKNIYLAYKIAKQWNISDENFCRAVRNFRGVPHRLEKCETLESYQGEIFNDSKSTNFEATITALEAMKAPCDVFIGGQIRGEEAPIVPAKLKDLLKQKGDRLFLIGEAAQSLELQLREFNTYNLGELSHFRTKDLKPENHILFSPGFPSFDQFKNFEARGDFFKQLIDKRIKDLN